MKQMITIVMKDDEYVVPYTEENVKELLEVDYNKRSPIVLNCGENRMVVVISSEVESFFTSIEEDSKECQFSSKIVSWEDDLEEYRRELQDIVSKMRGKKE